MQVMGVQVHALIILTYSAFNWDSENGVTPSPSSI